MPCCDLDDFTQVNDSQGHPAGDRLPAEVGRRLAGALRTGDTAARFAVTTSRSSWSPPTCLAMYWAKERGKSTIATYESALHAAALDRLQLRADLQRALRTRCDVGQGFLWSKPLALPDLLVLLAGSADGQPVTGRFHQPPADAVPAGGSVSRAG